MTDFKMVAERTEWRALAYELEIMNLFPAIRY